MSTSLKEGTTKDNIKDEQLIRLYLKVHKPELFDELVERYSNKVYAKCISLLKNEELANDAAQDIFLKVYLNLSKFNEKSKFSTWLYSITYNYCIDFLRKKIKKDKMMVYSEEPLPDIEDSEEIQEKELLEMEVERLQHVLDEMQIKDRSVLLMKYQDEMSIKEIAEALDKSESAVKMMIKRAKQKALKIYNTLYPK